jgi:hypothetical protein
MKWTSPRPSASHQQTLSSSQTSVAGPRGRRTGLPRQTVMKSCQVRACYRGGRPERLQCSRRARHSVRESPKRVVHLRGGQQAGHRRGTELGPNPTLIRTSYYMGPVTALIRRRASPAIFWEHRRDKGPVDGTPFSALPPSRAIGTRPPPVLASRPPRYSTKIRWRESFAVLRQATDIDRPASRAVRPVRADQRLQRRAVRRS